MAALQDTFASVADSELSSWDLRPFLEKVTGIAPCLIYVFNQQTQSNEYSNRSIATMLGYSAQEVVEMGASLLRNLLHPDDIGAVLQHFEDIRKLTDGDVLNAEYRVKHKAGHWVWLMSQDAVFQRNAAGAVSHHIGAAVDITAQKNAEAAVVEANEKSNAVNDELRAFAYAMSHDMKAPSNTLSLLLAELKHDGVGNFDEGQIALLDLARSTVSRMGLMIEDILAYTMVIGQEPVSETVDLCEILTEVLSFLRAEIQKSGATIEVQAAHPVKASRVQISILLQNLIQNALKFREEGTPPIITVEAIHNQVENRVDVTVRDNGIGIPPEKHALIFKPFGRLHNSAKYAGTGLGLSICRRIAANQGSKIAIVSVVGQGTAFTFNLPSA
ncbi:sensor histidine kinase [Yoonia sediminilitoris]|uniref:histidine kinase n=1 Tax=Yoonia sediminilitoris TaxID=1286148 RepID=A0A2T6K7Y2_9RHOB|nr:PAS domain-containing sensor histidine kinase [Yoonia sediminilitoris]PUB10841.1 hypothetical protein C8N45_11613 [Yoonia sediminilitoris]RCW90516.1 hypothetical protein DFP92_11613 [Yoonia sediminilitoris]